MLTTEFISKKPEVYDFETKIYVWDTFLPEYKSEHIEEQIFLNSNWRYINQATTDFCSHTIWGKSYMDSQVPYCIKHLIDEIQSKTGITFTKVEYCGLNGQTKGMDACPHWDCEPEIAHKNISILYYIGSFNSNGDLLLYNEDIYDGKRRATDVYNQIEFVGNRLIIFDGSKLHSAKGPDNDTFRMSLILRGQYAIN